MSANIFTDPEIATVGLSQKDADAKGLSIDVGILPLSRNPRAKMLGITDGFVKSSPRRGKPSWRCVVVAPRALPS